MLLLMLLKKEQPKESDSSSSSYAPIERALSTLPDRERLQLRKKFDIAFFLAQEKLSFRKYPRLCELESRHGVEVGSSYTNEVSARIFTGYIAESKRREMAEALTEAKLFSLLIDGSTDTGNIDNELYMIVYSDLNNGRDEKVHTRTSYFHVSRPSSVSAVGLFENLKDALLQLGISELSATKCSKLVGIGSDGAAANIAKQGLKGLVESQLEWIVWMWCFANRLELATKDALKGTFIDNVDDMLLKLYYLYEKSPKKCRELEDVVNDLKDCLHFDDAGVKPIRASGTRWIGHKLSAMRRVVSKFGAYTSHLVTLSEDPRIKSADRAKLCGYCTKWLDAKYLLGCAVFIDVLTPCAIFSKVLQTDELDILAALTSLLRTIKETEKLKSLPLTDWQTYSTTLKKMTKEDDKDVYQCQEVKRLNQATEYFSTHYQGYCAALKDCLRSRTAWSDQQEFRDIICVLATQGWEKLLEEDSSLSVLSRLVERFKVPLQSASTDITLIHEEFKSVVQYAVQFISLSTLDYRAVWWRNFHSPSSAEWTNVLTLIELLFALPASNGTLERAFSQMNVIKSEKRSLLSNQSLDDLLTLTIDSVPLEKFCPDAAIDLWWKDKLRRPNQRNRKVYAKRNPKQARTSVTDTREPGNVSSSESDGHQDSNSETDTDLLTNWDDWMDDCDPD